MSCFYIYQVLRKVYVLLFVSVFFRWDLFDVVQGSLCCCMALAKNDEFTKLRMSFLVSARRRVPLSAAYKCISILLRRSNGALWRTRKLFVHINLKCIHRSWRDTVTLSQCLTAQRIYARAFVSYLLLVLYWALEVPTLDGFIDRQ